MARNRSNPGDQNPPPGAWSDKEVDEYVSFINGASGGCGLAVTPTPIGAADLTKDTSPLSSQPWLMGQEYINKALDSDVYGGLKISYINKFDRYQQLEHVNPRLGMGLIKLALKIRGPALKYYIANDAGLPDEIAHGMLKDTQTFDLDIGLQSHFAACARLMARDGSVPVLNTADKRQGSGEGITKLDYMPMSHTTFLPRDVQPMSGFQNVEQLWEYGTILGEVTQVIMNERMMAKREIHYVKNGRITLFRLMHQGNQIRDIFMRRTIGLYGISLMDMLDAPAIKPMADIIWGFSKAIGRYGFGRLHIESDMLAKMIIEKQLTVAQATKITQAEQAVLNKLEPNRDILTVGKTINEVASAFTSASEVISFLELLQKDVSYVFCETEAGSMKAKGSTFASANVADQDSSRVIESIRNELKVGFESIIHRHLGLLGWDEDDAAAVKIELEPMQLPPQTIEALLQFDAQYPNLIMPEQMLELVGLHLPPRASVGLENTEQPLEPRAPDIPGINEPSVPGLRDYEKPTFYISPDQTLLKSRYRTAGRTYITPKGMKIRSAGRIPSEMWEQYKAADQGGKVCLQAAALDQRKAAGRTGRMVKIRGCHVFVPDGVEVAAAFSRQTGLSIEEAGDLEVLEQDFEKKTGWNKALSEQWNKHGSSGIP